MLKSKQAIVVVVDLGVALDAFDVAFVVVAVDVVVVGVACVAFVVAAVFCCRCL